MKILLISGHTSGYNKSALTGVNEGDLNIELVKLLTPRLGRYADVTVYPYSRDMYHDNKNGQIQVNLKEFDYIFEVHFNDFDNVANGTEIYVHQNYTGGVSVEEKILRNIVALGFRDRGLKRMSDLQNMNTCLALGIDYALLEVCFYDNQTDMGRYKPIKETVADAITAGIVEGFGLSVKETPNVDAAVLREISREDYIEHLIAPLAQSCWEKYGILPSPTIAQAILEPDFGKSELACGLGASINNIIKNGTAYGARNIFGIKRDVSKGTWESDVWKGATYYKQTAEQNADGTYKNIWAYFRSYETIADCVEDRAQYLTRAHKENGDIRFPNIVGETDPEKACEIIAAGGYATSHNYAKNLMRVIQEYDLTRFDLVVYVPWSAKVVNASALNVRKTPNGEIMELQLNTLPSITVIGEAQDSDGDTWYKVKVGETVTGYVWPEYVSR